MFNFLDKIDYEKLSPGKIILLSIVLSFVLMWFIGLVEAFVFDLASGIIFNFFYGFGTMAFLFALVFVYYEIRNFISEMKRKYHEIRK